MQRVTTDIGDAFLPLDTALRDVFLPDLFQGVGKGAPGQGFTRLLAKQVVIHLTDPINTAPESWTVSCVTTGHLVTLLRGQ